jgi:hypothetical protein
MGVPWNGTPIPFHNLRREETEEQSEGSRFQLLAVKSCHCERSEAIFSFKQLDCFVASLLAMTGTGKFHS